MTNLSKEAKSIMKLLPKRGDLLNPRCPTRDAIDSITGLWGVLILRALHENQVLRNADLKRLVPGISEKMLAQTLKRLERTAFVERRSYPVIPPKVEYRLTKLGQQCSVKLVDFCDFVEDHMRLIARQMLEYDLSDHSKTWQKPKR
ncbi:MAG: helix-turn-helix transcriptional regulator [Bdellovibrionales bacterium]|nr:helix-turn-helix transcriptional regulator [Bdellovibrionales bacterium]